MSFCSPESRSIVSKVEFPNFIFLMLKRKEIEFDNYLIYGWITAHKVCACHEPCVIWEEVCERVGSAQSGVVDSDILSYLFS